MAVMSDVDVAQTLLNMSQSRGRSLEADVNKSMREELEKVKQSVADKDGEIRRVIDEKEMELQMLKDKIKKARRKTKQYMFIGFEEGFHSGVKAGYRGCTNQVPIEKVRFYRPKSKYSALRKMAMDNMEKALKKEKELKKEAKALKEEALMKEAFKKRNF